MTDLQQRMERDMAAGLLQPLVLATVHRAGPIHGYGILKEMEQATGRTIWKEGTVYPLLAQLEKRGLLRSRWGEASHGPRRKDYAITTAGLAMLSAARASWEDLRDRIDNLLTEDTT